MRERLLDREFQKEGRSTTQHNGEVFNAPGVALTMALWPPPGFRTKRSRNGPRSKTKGRDSIASTTLKTSPLCCVKLRWPRCLAPATNSSTPWVAPCLPAPAARRTIAAVCVHQFLYSSSSHDRLRIVITRILKP